MQYVLDGGQTCRAQHQQSIQYTAIVNDAPCWTLVSSVTGAVDASTKKEWMNTVRRVDRVSS